jgi:hypothetical protein
MSAHYFDWSTIEEDIVVPEQAAIAVYNNPEGGVVLRQAGQYGPDEDTTVVLHPSHALRLARAILDRAGLELLAIVPLIDKVREANGYPAESDDGHGEQPDDANSKKDRTAAARQRRQREKQRERDSVIDAVTQRDTARDIVTTAPLVPELDLNGGQNKALAH